MTKHLSAIAPIVLVCGLFGVSSEIARAQKFTPKAPTAADWAALAKLPDFTGVWEVSPGSRGAATAPPSRPSLTPASEAKRKAYLAAAPEDTEAANCLPAGMPGIMGQPYPMEFLFTPGQVTIVIEAYTQVRHIYTDGRPLPEDPDEKFFGTSIGHWDNGTLVAETVGFSPQTELSANVPHSGRMKIVERFRPAD